MYERNRIAGLYSVSEALSNFNVCMYACNVCRQHLYCIIPRWYSFATDCKLRISNGTYDATVPGRQRVVVCCRRLSHWSSSAPALPATPQRIFTISSSSWCCSRLLTQPVCCNHKHTRARTAVHSPFFRNRCRRACVTNRWRRLSSVCSKTAGYSV